MKILIYGLNYAPEPTGTGKYTAELAEWLAARGHKVGVVCGLPHYPQWKLDPAYADGRTRVEDRCGVRVYRAPHYVPSGGRLSARVRIRVESSFTLSAARYWLRWLMAWRRADVVIAPTPPMQIGVWPLLYRWVRRVPWVLHVQDLQVDAALRLNLLNASALTRALYAIEAFLLRHATRVSTITEAMRARIIEKGVAAASVWVCPNWADIAAIRPAARDNAFRSSLALRTDALLVLYAGSVGEKQGLELVLQAAARCQDDTRLLFLIVGEGAAKARLQQHAAAMKLANVRFLPVQPVERLSDMLAAGDIHLVVQKRDAADLVMPSKLTNILAAGRACVATADPGTALYDVVQGHGTGKVVAPGDAEQLADAIRVLADDPEARARCGQRAREYAERYLDRDRILSAFEQQLKTLCRE